MTMTLFDAWQNLPDEGRNANRAAVARGQFLFNNVVLHLNLGGASIDGLPPNQDRCIGCHATTNLGNNPSPAFFIRLGVDSVDPNTPNSLAQLAAADPRVKSLLDRASKLPEYCLRPTTDPTPFSTAPCGSDATDVKTTDPGRAMVTGKIANVGAFKPPILRNVAVRCPCFHNGAAETLDDLVNFYNARFQIGLTQQQHDDLVAFLGSL
jgi:cytochrome c peroxidase